MTKKSAAGLKRASLGGGVDKDRNNTPKGR